MTVAQASDDVKFPHPIPGAPLLSRLLMRAVSRYKIVGQHNIPRNEQYLMTANHLSYFDVPTIAGALDKQTWLAAFAAKKYKGTYMEPFFRMGSAVWIEQDSPDRKAIAEALALMKAGYNFGIAPEGHRSRTGALIEGTEGAAFLATRANVQVLPAAIWGTERILKHPRPKVTIVIGKPYRLPEGRAKGDQLKLYTERIMCAIAALLPEAYHGVYAGHPLIEEMKEIVGA